VSKSSSCRDTLLELFWKPKRCLEEFPSQPPTLLNRPKSNLLITTTRIEKSKLIFIISDPIIVILEISRIFQVLSKIDGFLVGGWLGNFSTPQFRSGVPSVLIVSSTTVSKSFGGPSPALTAEPQTRLSGISNILKIVNTRAIDKSYHRRGGNPKPAAKSSQCPCQSVLSEWPEMPYRGAIHGCLFCLTNII
jgi:hypothetical protein